MNRISILAAASVLFALTGCGRDNYDAPESVITGTVVYKDAQGAEHPVGVRGTHGGGENDGVYLNLYQPGYELKDPVKVFCAQEGTFKALMFDGYYVLRFANNRGPWVFDSAGVVSSNGAAVHSAAVDSAAFTLKGSANIVMYVTPYNWISNVSITLAGNTLTAAFDLEKVVPNNVDWVRVVVNRTRFADDAYNLVKKDLSFSEGVNSLSVTLSDEEVANLAKYPLLFARIGVRSQAQGQALYSEIKQVK